MRLQAFYNHLNACFRRVVASREGKLFHVEQLSLRDSLPEDEATGCGVRHSEAQGLRRCGAGGQYCQPASGGDPQARGGEGLLHAVDRAHRNGVELV